MRRRALTALVLLVVAAAAVIAVFVDRGPRAAPPGLLAGGPPVPKLLGIESAGQIELLRLDPRTLRPRPGRRVPLGSEGCAPRDGGSICWNVPPWSFSPDRSRLAVARHETGVVRALRVVDVARMRAAMDIPIKPSGAIGLLAWPQSDRLLAVQEVCCDERQQVLVIDAGERAVTARRPLRGTVEGVGRTPRELVLLVAPAKRIGPARLAVVDDRGDVRFAALDRIRAGSRLLPGDDFLIRRRRPGLALDPRGRRAYVVDPDIVASVDLATLTVSYHVPSEQRSLAARIRDWLDPAAYAKGVNGPTRSARWLDDGRLAVTGVDEELGRGARGEERQRTRPAGLRLIDTREWTYRVIDAGVTAVRVAGRLLLATGQSADLAPGAARTTGLTAYEMDGSRRFTLFAGREAWVEQVAGRRAFVQAGVGTIGTAPAPRVVDLRSGRVSRRPTVLPTLLLEPARSWWDE